MTNAMLTRVNACTQYNEAMWHKLSHRKPGQKVLQGNHPQTRYIQVISGIQLCGDLLCTRYHHSQLFHFPKSRSFTTCHKNYMLYPPFITLILTILLTSIQSSSGYHVCQDLDLFYRHHTGHGESQCGLEFIRFSSYVI